MIEIKYTITDALGIHARPAGRLVKQAAAFPCDVLVGTPAKMVDAKRILGVMALALKQGDEMTMTFHGEQESQAAISMAGFLATNL